MTILQPFDFVVYTWLIIALLSSAYVAFDQFRNNPEAKVMKWGFMLVTLYMGPIGLLLYVLSDKEPYPGTHEAFIEPLWKQGVWDLPYTDETSMSALSITSAAEQRQETVRRGILLSYVTIAYNGLEGLGSLIVGILSGSVALVGFGIDSVIEVTSSAAAQWRLRSDVDASSRERCLCA